MTRGQKRALRIVGAILALYGGICLLLVVFETELLFHPTRLPDVRAAQLAARPEVEELAIAADGATLRGHFVAGEHYPLVPVQLLMRNDIDSASRAPRVAAPALIVHGEADRVIPIAHGRSLAERWGGPVALLTLPHVGHNDADGKPESLRALGAFLDRVDPALGPAPSAMSR